jgi:adenylate cyclase
LIKLNIIEAEGSEKIYELSSDTIIGRDPSCGIVIADPAISRTHAKITVSEDACWVEDLESKAGTFVNGQRVDVRVELLEGDLLRVGPAAVTVHFNDDGKSEHQSQEPAFHDKGSGKLTRRIAIDTDHFSATSRYFRESKASGASVEEISVQLESLLQLSTNIVRFLDRPGLFKEIARQLLDFFSEADRVIILEAGDSEEEPQRVKLVHYGPHARRQSSVRLSREVLENAISKKQAVLHEQREPPLEADAPRAVLCAPLWHGDIILGSLYLDGRTANFSESSLRFLTAMANIVASALQNVRLFEAVRTEAAQRANLARYFSKDLVERILKNEVKPARKGDLHRATILMVDLCGFSRLTTQVSPSLLISSLNHYFGAMQRIIFKNSGTVERFGGDSILAYWGVIEPDRFSAWRACLAAIAMQNEMLPLNFKLKKAGTPTLAVAIGLNTGEIIAGDVGSEERYEFTVLGDAVNMSRRLQELAGPNQIFVGLECSKAAGRAALFKELSPVRVKGREQPLKRALLYGVRTASDSGVRYELSLGVVVKTDEEEEEYGRVIALRYSRTDTGYIAFVTLNLLAEIPPGFAEMIITLAQESLHYKVRVIGDSIVSEATVYWTGATAMQDGPVETEVAVMDAEGFLKALYVIS